MFSMVDKAKEMVATEPKYVVDDLAMPEELLDAMLSIKEMTDSIVRAIPEDVFRRKYLPMFMSTEKKVDMSPWLDICGTAYEPVNVIKGGRVIFVIPPLVKRHPTIINVDSRFSAPTIIKEAQQYQERHPKLGVAHLVKHLSTKVFTEGVNLEEVAQWNTVLTYYGYPTIGDIAPAGSEDDTPQHTELDDDDFEEA